MATAAPTSATPASLPIRLVTQNTKYSIPGDTYLIPAHWKRFQLSQLINKVLALPVAVPFDFVVDGELVRGGLGEWLHRRAGGAGGAEETVTEVEYIESVLPPKRVGEFEHDDWVGAVSVQKKGLFLTGCYDSRVRVFNGSQQLLHTISPGQATGGVTSVSWLPHASSSSSPSDSWLAAGSMDGITRVYSLPGLDAASVPAEEGIPSQAVSRLALHHHTSAISSLAASPSSNHLLTSSWDGTLAVFPLAERSSHSKEVPQPLQPSKLAVKRRKLDKSIVEEEGVAEGGWRTAPEVVLRGHVGRVGKAIWDKAGVKGEKVWSCGWDGSVRGWDVETEINFLTKQAPSDKICLDMDQFAGGSSQLVTSHADRTVCLWDTRDEATIISLTVPNAHTSQIPFVRAHPTSAHLFATAGHDGALKVWDVRSPKQALLGVERTQQGEKKGDDKLLCGDWDGEILGVGGEGCKLEVYRGAV